MKIEVTQCSMCKHYSEEQYCEIWQQYITNDAFYCACGAKADRKTENSSEIPNNCEYAENSSGDVWECGCFLDTYCEHQIYDRNPDGTINIVECGYEPKDEPQACSVNGRPYSECADCEYFKCTADEPQMEGSSE